MQKICVLVSYLQLEVRFTDGKSNLFILKLRDFIRGSH